jgi:hypothetical protein
MRAAAAVLLLALGCKGGQPPASPAQLQPLATFLTDAGEVTVAVEIAADPEARATGLMRREHLAAFAGMVFVFPAQAEHPFWMKNTLIPLDMIFIDDELRVVGIIENAEPLTDTMRSVTVPSRYVVEVNGGFAARHGITVGTRVVLEHVL